MNYENSLNNIISNHLDESELNSFNLNEINLSYGIDFYDAKNGISRIIFTDGLGELKPTQDEVVRLMSARGMLEALEAANENDNDYEVDYGIDDDGNESVIFTYYW